MFSPELTGVLSFIHAVDAMQTFETFITKLWLNTITIALLFLAFMSSTDTVMGMLSRLTGILLMPSFVCTILNKSLFKADWWMNIFICAVALCWCLFDYKQNTTRHLVHAGTLTVIYFMLLYCGRTYHWKLKRYLILWNAILCVGCFLHLTFMGVHINLRLLPSAIILVRMYKHNHLPFDNLLVLLATVALFCLLGFQLLV